MLSRGWRHHVQHPFPDFVEDVQPQASTFVEQRFRDVEHHGPHRAHRTDGVSAPRSATAPIWGRSVPPHDLGKIRVDVCHRTSPDSRIPTATPSPSRAIADTYTYRSGRPPVRVRAAASNPEERDARARRIHPRRPVLGRHQPARPRGRTSLLPRPVRMGVRGRDARGVARQVLHRSHSRRRRRGGRVDPEGAPPTATWNTYIWVDSADESAAKARDAGGAVVMEPFDVMDAVGWRCSGIRKGRRSSSGRRGGPRARRSSTSTAR